MKEAIFIHLQETNGASTGKNADMLKAVLTEEKQTINSKGIDAYEVESYWRLFGTTNNSDPVKIEKGDRRFAVMWAGNRNKNSPDAPETIRQYWKETEEEYFSHEEGIRAIYDYLMTEDLTSFDIRKIPETSIRAELMAAEMANEERFFRALAEEKEGVDEEEMTNELFYNSYRAWCGGAGVQPRQKQSFDRKLFPYLNRGWYSPVREMNSRKKVIYYEIIRVS